MSRPLRLAFFNRSYYPDFGATGQLLTELCEDLVGRHGHQVTVVAGVPLSSAVPVSSPRWYRPVREEWHNGVRILRAYGTTLDKRRFTGRATNYMSYFASALFGAVRLGRVDVVIALTDPPIIGLPASAAATMHGARFVFLCQDIFPEVARLLEDFQSDRVEALLTRVGKFTVGHADAIVALGDTMKRRLVETKDADPSRIRVIHNWADCDAIVPASKDNPFSRAHGLVDRFVVMHSGNVGLSQGVDRLLDVAERVRDLTDVVIAIVGDGAQKLALVNAAEARQSDERQIFPVSAEVVAHRLVRDRRRVPRVAEARPFWLHRAEQALRHPRRGPAVHRRGRRRFRGRRHRARARLRDRRATGQRRGDRGRDSRAAFRPRARERDGRSGAQGRSAVRSTPRRVVV